MLSLEHGQNFQYYSALNLNSASYLATKEQRTCSEEGEDKPIGRKCIGHRFLGFTRCDVYRPAGEELY